MLISLSQYSVLAKEQWPEAFVEDSIEAYPETLAHSVMETC